MSVNVDSDLYSANKRRRLNYHDDYIIRKVNCLLVDIEGTTTSIDFVKEILLPYGNQIISDFLKENWTDPEVAQTVQAMMYQSRLDLQKGFPGFAPIPYLSPENLRHLQSDDVTQLQNAIIKNYQWQLQTGNLSQSMKEFQGHMWAFGYDHRDISGHVYNEVAFAFDLWDSNGKKIYIYSNGSAKAQLYHFRYSVYGDLGNYIKGYFDGSIGHKCEPASYENISSAIREPPGKILFLTDKPDEAIAAKRAGLHVLIVVRDDNPPLSDAQTAFFEQNDGIIHSFLELLV